MCPSSAQRIQRIEVFATHQTAVEAAQRDHQPENGDSNNEDHNWYRDHSRRSPFLAFPLQLERELLCGDDWMVFQEGSSLAGTEATTGPD